MDTKDTAPNKQADSLTTGDFTGAEEPWALFRLEVAALDPAGDDRVLALITFHGTSRDSGEEVAIPYAHLATFRGDEVARIDAYSDWDEARRAAGLEE